MTETDGAFAGAVARGVVAAMAMSGMRRLTTALGLLGEEPPEQVAREGVPGLVARVPPSLRGATIELAHWGYGAAGGAGFGVLPAAVRRRPWAGPAFGLATWLFFETTVAPALGLRRTRESRALERAAIAADHVLNGVVVAGRTV